MCLLAGGLAGSRCRRIDGADRWSRLGKNGLLTFDHLRERGTGSLGGTFAPGNEGRHVLAFLFGEDAPVNLPVRGRWGEQKTALAGIPLAKVFEEIVEIAVGQALWNRSSRGSSNQRESGSSWGAVALVGTAAVKYQRLYHGGKLLNCFCR